MMFLFLISAWWIGIATTLVAQALSFKWKCATRGEFHCPTCKQVTALPKDEY